MPPARIDVKAGLRIIAVLALLIAVVAVGGRYYVQAFMPLYTVTIDIAHPAHRLRMLEIDSKDGARIRLEMERRTVLRDASGTLRPAMVLERASTQMGYVLAHPFILFGVVLVWPGLSLRQRLERLLVSLPLLVIVEALDIPLVLAGGIEDTFASTGQTGAGVDWVRIMDGGGRYVLCFAAAGMAAAIHAFWMKSRPARN